MATLADGLLQSLQLAQQMGQRRFDNNLARERMDMLQRDQNMRAEQLAIAKDENRRAEEQNTRLSQEWAVRKPYYLNQVETQDRELQFQDNQNFTAGLSNNFLSLIKPDGSVNAEALMSLQTEDQPSFSHILGQNTEWLTSGQKPAKIVGIVPKDVKDLNNPNAEAMYAIEIMDADGNKGFITDNASNDPNDTVTFFTGNDIAKVFGKNYKRILDAGGARSGNYMGYQMSSVDEYMRGSMEEAAGIAVGNMVAENPDDYTEAEIRRMMLGINDLSDADLEKLTTMAGGDIEAIKAAAKEEYDRLNPTISVGKYRSFAGATDGWNEGVTELSQLENSIPELQAAYDRAVEGGYRVSIDSTKNALRNAQAAVQTKQQELDEIQSKLEGRIARAETAFDQMQSGTISEDPQNRLALRDLKNIDALRQQLAGMDSSVVMPNTQLASGISSPGFTLTRESLLQAAQDAGQNYLSNAEKQKQAAYLNGLGVNSAQSLADKVPEQEFLAHVYAMLPAMDNVKDRTDFVQSMLNLKNRGAMDYSLSEQIDDATTLGTLNQRYNEFQFSRQQWAVEQQDKNDAAVTKAVEAGTAVRTALAENGIDSPELIAAANDFFRTSRNEQAAGGRLKRAFLGEEVEVAAALLGAYAKELGNDGWLESMIRADQPIKLFDLAESLVVNKDGSKIAFATPKGARVANLYQGEMLVSDLNEVFGNDWLKTLTQEVAKKPNRVLDF